MKAHVCAEHPCLVDVWESSICDNDGPPQEGPCLLCSRLRNHIGHTKEITCKLMRSIQLQGLQKKKNHGKILLMHATHAMFHMGHSKERLKSTIEASSLKGN